MESDDEELDRRPDPRVSRRAWIAGALVAAGLLAVAVGTAGGDDPAPPPTPSPTRNALPQRIPIPVGAVVTPTGDGRLVFFSGDVLTLLAPSGRILAERRYPIRKPNQGPPQVRLLVDRPAGLVWVVSNDGVTRGNADQFSFDGLDPIARIPLPTVLDDVAAVHGDLYVLGGTGLFRLLRNTERFTRVGPAHVVRVVAEPTQQRVLLLVRSAAGVTVRSLDDDLPANRAALPLAPEPQLTLVGDAVWGVGSLRGRAWVARLDPGTLVFGRNYAPARIGRGADLAGIGDRSVFVQAGNSLECFDTATRRFVQAWPSDSGPVAATRHRAVVSGTSGVVRSLPLNACRG